MSSVGMSHTPVHRRFNRRGLSPITSTVVIVVVLALVGIATYGVMGGFSSSGPVTTCEPVTSFVCGQFVNLHDVSLLVPFKSVQQGNVVPFTISLPPSETPTKVTLNYGDGTPSVSNSSTSVSYSYSHPGTYIVEAQATVNGLVHDNLPRLTVLTVTPAYSAGSVGNLPAVVGSLTGNSTTAVGTTGATGVIHSAQSVSVNGSYSSAPTNPQFTPVPPRLLAPGGSFTSNASGATWASGTVTYTNPGTYDITFVGASQNGNVTLYQNYTWTVFVAASGTVAGAAGAARSVSPHPGQLEFFELAPGGAASEDPAIDYETVGMEPIFNVYQTLISYNGTASGPTPNDFIPNLATCVPGSPECTSLYGAPLVNSAGTEFTFVINPDSAFYDGATQKSWGVWPTDVLFSYARTMGFSTLPCVSCNNGWIIAQALLSSGSATWDTIHSTYNNTPQNIFNAIQLNDTSASLGGAACPQSVLNNPALGHGCVTFNASGNGHLWPYFLELVADAQGGSIVSCGWFSASAQGAGIPYWTSGNSSGAGDHPCGAPGTAGWGEAPALIPPQGWDQWEQLGSGSFGYYLGHVQWSMVGSGPYYVSTYSVGISYTLRANPGYVQNEFCTWNGCEPKAGDYANQVSVTWETTATPGEDALVAGAADGASVPTQDLSLLLQLINQGKVNAVSAPTLTIGFYPFNLQFSVGAAQKFTTNPISVSSDWFSYLGMREFFARAYPYQTVEQSISTRDGIQFSFDYGGAIPQFMANYYPTNIAWPSTDPCSDPTNSACPIYWWDQMQNTQSPYYDAEVAQCSTNNPCQLPMFGTTGSATNDEIMSLWASSVSSITNGAVKVTPVDINFVDVLTNSESTGPTANPMPLYSLGWAPDYPDPTDYVAPLYAANGTYGYGDALAETFYTPQFSSGCAVKSPDYNYFANNTTWGNACQGEAYKAMLNVLGMAAVTSPGPYRVLLYDIAEKIASQLSLYVYSGQSNLVATAASWIDINSLDTNVTVGGGGISAFFWLTGNGVQFAGST